MASESDAASPTASGVSDPPPASTAGPQNTVQPDLMFKAICGYLLFQIAEPLSRHHQCFIMNPNDDVVEAVQSRPRLHVKKNNPLQMIKDNLREIHRVDRSYLPWTISNVMFYFDCIEVMKVFDETIHELAPTYPITHIEILLVSSAHPSRIHADVVYEWTSASMDSHCPEETELYVHFDKSVDFTALNICFAYESCMNMFLQGCSFGDWFAGQEDPDALVACTIAAAMDHLTAYTRAGPVVTRYSPYWREDPDWHATI